MPFENPQAAAAPTRRSSRPRTAASEASASGSTAPLARESPRPFLIAGGVTLHDRLRGILDEEKP
ncbi:hypothetical protein CTI14_41625 [Methylobacterium radiotolerans]|nr:hypothetical protein CTI14_41625 [Methylobacterium radiotolerans]